MKNNLLFKASGLTPDLANISGFIWKADKESCMFGSERMLLNFIPWLLMLAIEKQIISHWAFTNSISVLELESTSEHQTISFLFKLLDFVVIFLLIVRNLFQVTFVRF